MSDPIAELPAPRHIFWTCLWLFLFLLAIRLLRAFLLQRDLTNDDCEVDRVAFALANHLGFANPFKIPTGPTSQYAPGYPLLLSWIYELFGRGPAAEAVRQALSCAAVSLEFALLPFLALVAGMDARVGILAALLGGLSPLRNWIETKATFETPYAALLLVIVTILTLQLWKLDKLPTWRAWLYGAVWGLALLVAPQLLPILCAYLAVGVVRFRDAQLWPYLRFSGVALIAVGIVLAPWTIRNYRTFHRLIFVRSGFALMLNISNNDSAAPEVEQNIRTQGFLQYSPLYSMSAAQAIQQSGEPAFYGQQFHIARAWILTHPQKFARLTADHFRYFWFPPLGLGLRGTVSTLLTWCFTLAGMAGLFLMLRHHPWPGHAIGAVWLIYPLVYYLTVFDPRYRYPIEWTFLFTAAYGSMALVGRVHRKALGRQISSLGPMANSLRSAMGS